MIANDDNPYYPSLFRNLKVSDACIYQVKSVTSLEARQACLSRSSDGRWTTYTVAGL